MGVLDRGGGVDADELASGVLPSCNLGGGLRKGRMLGARSVIRKYRTL